MSFTQFPPSLLTSTDSCFCPFVFHFFCCAFSISEAYCFQFSVPTLWHLLWSYTLTTLPFCLYLFQSLDTVDWEQPTSFATLCAELPFSKEFLKPLPLFQLTALSLEPCLLPISLVQHLIKGCSFFNARLICLFILKQKACLKKLNCVASFCILIWFLNFSLPLHLKRFNLIKAMAVIFVCIYTKPVFRC